MLSWAGISATDTYTNFVQIGVFRVTIRVRPRIDTSHMHKYLKSCPPLIRNRAGCIFKEVSLPEMNPSDLYHLIYGVIVVILWISKAWLNDRI